MTTPVDRYISPEDQEKLKVLKCQAHDLQDTSHQVDDLLTQQEERIKQTEELLAEFRIATGQSRLVVATDLQPAPYLRSWEEIVADTEQNPVNRALFSDILSPSEIAQVEQKIVILRGDFHSLHHLDALDWTICGVAGVLAALVDIFFVQMPKHPGFLGGTGADGGPLSNWMRERINSTLSPKDIAQLEKVNWVPFDSATSTHLNTKIEGLGPAVHRFHSLGHDPVLGFIVGVADILRGTFTAIDKNGRLILQPVAISDPAILTMNLFEAIGRVFGHLLSDVATPAGLPVPLMPLLQFFQFGEIGARGYTIGEVSRIMYRSHYDFRHFLAMSVSPLLIEVVVRLSYFAKRRYEGCSLTQSLPFEFSPREHKPKLRTMLFAAHLLSTAANAGKVAIGQNPLLINYSQWVAFFRYAVSQLKWSFFDHATEEADFVQRSLADDWTTLDDSLDATWRMVSGAPVMLA